MRLNKEIKEHAAKVVSGMGLDLSTAVNMFLVEISQTNKLPFTSTGDPEFPDIWNDDPQDIAKFNEQIGIADDGRNYGKKTTIKQGHLD
ncbi:type II toxin-antitoxin system RelB/DinJ family antitoxin [Levilactobacillus tujiorum]|uniref:type II toxin-antitoxin system RelB/DinJ family antitoxin n=1 Tax=Levilactobacillus tujiorum TaxID=2912243 RepID=UPI002FD81C7F